VTPYWKWGSHCPEEHFPSHPRPDNTNQKRPCGSWPNSVLECPSATWRQIPRRMSSAINSLFTPLVVDSNIVIWKLPVRPRSTNLFCFFATWNAPRFYPCAAERSDLRRILILVKSFRYWALKLANEECPRAGVQEHFVQSKLPFLVS
jgi:hypothetical protein